MVLSQQPARKKDNQMQPNQEVMESLSPGQKFCFSCNASVPCFTECCRSLNLMLTPYDVLRLRRALHMDSTDFLDRYALRITDPDWKVPVLQLKMEETPTNPCPFVSEEGCGVYGDRPGACRAYPVGRGARRTVSRSGPPVVEEKYFLVKEPHCRGFEEAGEWTAEGWMKDQGLEIFNEMNDRWMAFLTRYRPGNREDFAPKQWQMFFMACYSQDRFREFVFGTRFLSLFDIPAERQEIFRENDEELLKFSFQWLAFSLFGDPVLKMKPPPPAR